ncbi:MAG: IucA/IucC family protein [Haloechinothrix sp.]
MSSPDPIDLVLRDLIDTLLQENVYGLADIVHACAEPPEPGAELAERERWCRIAVTSGWLVFRGRDGGALQPYRFSRGPLWHCGGAEGPRTLAPSELLTILASKHGAGTRTAEVAADLRASVEHAAVTLAGSLSLPERVPRPGGMLAAERLAATRNRPFHPTARAAAGWSAAELARYGPMRRGALGVDWVGVRRDGVRYGSGADSNRMEHLVLGDHELELLAEAAHRAGVNLDQYQPLPVHPWQFEHVLPREYASELDTRDVVPLTRGLGRFHPTSSLRTLTTAPESELHLKLPLGVATLGAARLLPPRYLDNAERAQHTMRRLLTSDPRLGTLVDLCDERTWCGWRSPDADDEFADRPGQLAAQVRAYPGGLFGDPDSLILPMAALAAHEWQVLHPAIGEAGFDDDPVRLFRLQAESFCALGFGFLRYGVLPELHGQNVVVVLAQGAVRRFVLRDHDTLRLYPEWMRASGVPDPGYRIKPGATQSLRLPSAQALLGYLQTLGFQVNLYGIADALARHYDLDERALWSQLREAVIACLDRLGLPGRVADVLDRELLRATEWPSRQVLRPLLRRGRSAGVSMPASAGRVPNPLLPKPRR